MTDVKKNLRNFKETTLCLRLTENQAMRFWQIMDAAKSRDAYVDKSDVHRELLELSPPSVITKEEITFFRTGKK